MTISAGIDRRIDRLLGAVYFAGSTSVGAAPEDAGSRSQRAASSDAASSNSSTSPTSRAARWGSAAVQLRGFELTKTAVGTIDFNQNMLVQVFSQYPGKILKANFNIGDEVAAGRYAVHDRQPGSAAGGIDAARDRRRPRNAESYAGAGDAIVEAGGSAQKDVDQSTSDQQTAEGNFKAAKDAVRIFGKTDAEIDQIVAQRKVEFDAVGAEPDLGKDRRAQRRAGVADAAGRSRRRRMPSPISRRCG